MKLSMGSLFLLFIIGQPFYTIGQSNLHVLGKVVDEESNEPMSFSSVSVKGKTVGTVSNADGVFDFYIPFLFQKDTLTVSMMGYAPYNILIEDALKLTNLIVKLKMKSIILKEVEIINDKRTGQEIMLKAFEKIEDNFPVRNYNYKAFFREMFEENEKAVLVVEAVVDIYDPGFRAIKTKRNWLVEKVHAENVRTSVNYMKSCFRTLSNFSYLTYSLQWRNIKYRDPNFVGFIKKQKFEIDSLITLNNDQLFVISSSHSSSQAKSKDIYYINANTYAIHKHVISDIANNGQILNQWKMFKDSNYFYQNKSRYVVQEYENYDGKMYLKYVSGKFTADIYDKKTKVIDFTLNTTEMLVVSEIHPDDEMVPVNLKTVAQYKMLSNETQVYDHQFWNNFGEVKQVPLTKKQLKELEWNIPLEQQFSKTSGANSNKTNQEK